MDNLSTQGDGNQSMDGIEPAGQGLDGGEQSQDIAGDNSVQPQGNDGNANQPENLPPELEGVKKKLFQDYHDKTQKLAVERRELEGKMKDLGTSQQVLSQLMEAGWFREAYQNEKARRSGQVSELTDEQFESVKNDKRAFHEYIRKQAEAIAESRMGPELGKTKQELKAIQHEREFDIVAKQYPDFKALNDRGAFDDDLQKGFDYKTAYARYKLGDGSNDKSSIEREAERILAARKAGSVDRPGGPNPRGQRIIKAKKGDIGGALDQLFAAHDRGETNLKLEAE